MSRAGEVPDKSILPKSTSNQRLMTTGTGSQCGITDASQQRHCDIVRWHSI